VKIVDVAQGSVEWLEARAGIPTASEFDALITPKGEPRRGEGVKSYLALKLAERWCGPILGGGNSFATEQGKILEGECFPWLEFEFEWKLSRVGFITTDDGRVGCSPDGLIDPDGGCEIKAPEAKTHIKYLLDGKVPAEYIAQIQGSLFVTQRSFWRFISYRRHFPPVMINVYPDPAFQEGLAETLSIFLDTLDRSYAYLVEKNGGPPPRRVKMAFADDIAAGRAEEHYEGIIP